MLKLLGWYKIIWILLEIDTLSVKCAETAILRNVGESLVWLTALLNRYLTDLTIRESFSKQHECVEKNLAFE